MGLRKQEFATAPVEAINIEANAGRRVMISAVAAV